MHNFSFIYITCHYGCDVETGCKMKKYLFLALFVCLLPDVAAAGMREYFQQVQRDVKETWKSDEYDLFVPVYAWHNRLTYDQKHIDKYNENPWGLGFGKTRYDENGNWHSLYAMAFKDSNKYLETIFGYAWMKNWFVNCNRDFRVGLGYTLSLTQRHELNIFRCRFRCRWPALNIKRLLCRPLTFPASKTTVTFSSSGPVSG